MNILSDLKELLLPRLCPVCGKLLMQNEDVMCAYCAIGLPRHHIPNIIDNPMLRSVWDKVNVQRSTTFLAYNHNSPYHNLVIDFKFHGMSDNAVRLGHWAALEAERLDFFEGVDISGHREWPLADRGVEISVGKIIIEIRSVDKARFISE